MPFKLQFLGGVEKPRHNITEKFLAFSVVNGVEIPVYEMIRNSLIFADPEAYADAIPSWVSTWLQSDRVGYTELQARQMHQICELSAKHRYVSLHPILKLFLFKSGFGIPKSRRTFFVKLFERGGHEVSIRPFSRELAFFFYAPHAILLGDNEVKGLLKPSPSLKFFEEEQKTPLPPVVMDSILQVRTRPLDSVEGVRKLKV